MYSYRVTDILIYRVTDIPIPKRSAGVPRPPQKITECVVCGIRLKPPINAKRRYCSSACSKHATKNRNRTARGLPPLPYAKEWSNECPNCGTRFVQVKSQEMYCSVLCYNEADLVRYFRRKRIEYGDPANMPEDVREAIKTRFAHTLNGGYDHRARHLTDATRKHVWERDAGKCVLCGKPGEEVDHIDGSDNAPSNLRLLCRDCHHSITASHMAPIEKDDAETLQHRDKLHARMYAPEALTPSDSEYWSDRWRTWLEEHRQPIM